MSGVAGRRKPAHLGHRVAFMLIVMLALGIVALLPFVVSSVFQNIFTPAADHLYRLTPPGTVPAATRSYLHLDVVSVDEWARTATVRVAGDHVCETACEWSDQILLVSYPPPAEDGEGLPPAQKVTFSQTGHEVTQEITLPIYGEPVRYPFDHYQLELGVILQRVYPDGTVQPVSAADARGHLFLSVHQQAPRVRLDTPIAVSPQSLPSDGPQYPYVLVSRLTFSRPLYVRVMSVVLVLLVSAAAAYAVFMQPLHQLIVNVGALILGIWGIRAILLGPNVPGITSIDLALSVVILFLLAAITARTLWYAKARCEVYLPWERRRL